MSLIENAITQISANGLGGISRPQEFDLNDSTFDNLLKNAIENNPILNSNLQTLGDLGQPSGMIIEPFEEISAIQPINKNNQINNDSIQIKDVDMGSDYFSSLLKESPQEHTSIMNVAKRYATMAYNTFGKNLVEDLADFAHDVTSMS